MSEKVLFSHILGAKSKVAGQRNQHFLHVFGKSYVMYQESIYRFDCNMYGIGSDGAYLCIGNTQLQFGKSKLDSSSPR